ncbi:unnamed protein product [Effrenium voratum]|nr:unnamed protein product [Effrenium voratum]
MRPRNRAPAVVLAPPPPPARPPPAVAQLPKTEVQKVRFDFGYDDIEGGNLLGKLLGSLQEDRLSVQEAVRALEADLRSQAPRAAVSTNLKADRKSIPCRRCNVLSLQLEALAQSMVGIAGAAFRWSLEVAGASEGDRRGLWKDMLAYLQPCAHVDVRIASTSDELLKSLAKDETPDELLRSLAPTRAQERAEELQRLAELAPPADADAPAAGADAPEAATAKEAEESRPRSGSLVFSQRPSWQSRRQSQQSRQSKQSKSRSSRSSRPSSSRASSASSSSGSASKSSRRTSKVESAAPAASPAPKQQPRRQSSASKKSSRDSARGKRSLLQDYDVGVLTANGVGVALCNRITKNLSAEEGKQSGSTVSMIRTSDGGLSWDTVVPKFLGPSLLSDNWKEAYVYAFDTLPNPLDQSSELIYYNGRNGWKDAYEEAGVSRFPVEMIRDAACA